MKEYTTMYTQRNKIYWTPEVTLEISAYLMEERKGSKGQNLYVDDNY
jgi:hypothetical protein